MSSVVKCVDLSSWQAGFDFHLFKSGGGLAVILKASESLRADNHYKIFRPQALDANLAVASYHFFRPGDPVKQAQLYYNTAEPRKGERVVCDFEDAHCDFEEVFAFLKHLQSCDPTLQLTVYGSSSFLVGKMRPVVKEDRDWLFANTSLWVAEYSSRPAPSTTCGWPAWSLWQYSEHGRVPGFAADVDVNRFDGTDDLLLKWFGPNDNGEKHE